MKRFLLLLLSIILIITVSGCASEPKSNPTLPPDNVVTQAPETTTEPTETQTETQVDTVNYDEVTTTEPTTVITTEYSEVETTTLAETTTETTTVIQQEEKKTDMSFSSSPDNMFIRAVADKYSVNPSNLVAFYETGESGNSNLVIEFDGSTDSSGKPIRTTSTFVNVYVVNGELQCAKATGDDRELSEKDGKKFEYMTKLVILKFFASDIANA